MAGYRQYVRALRIKRPSEFSPLNGFSNSFQGPQIEEATADRPAFGAQPVQPDIIKYISPSV